jgi:pimeloyl-ACP methyl ester carboxylesterase
MFKDINGIRIAYTDEGQGAPLLFVHGFPLSRATWSKQVAFFKANHRVIAPDLRGLGESASGPGPVSMSRFAEDLHDLAQRLSTGPVVLVGHSMGGYVALAFAMAYPNALSGLVLVGTKAGKDSPEAAAARRATAEKVRTEGVSVVVDAMAPKMLSASREDPAMAAAVHGIMAASKPDGVMGALWGMADRPDASARLGQIRVPTLVITGADDTVIPPSESVILAESIPGAQLTVIPEAGHLVAFERADAFNEALNGWLDSRNSAPGFRGTISASHQPG